MPGDPRAQRRIVILGTGGNCLDILDCLRDANDAAGETFWDCIGFLDDNSQFTGRRIEGVPVLGPLAIAESLSEVCFVNGIGSPLNHRRKQAIIARTGIPDERFATIIHPSARISSLATVDRGCVILQNCVVNARARLGRHVMVLPLSVISHDTVVGDYATLASAVVLAGNVSIGDHAYIGANASVRGYVSIGRGALVGIGSTVLRDVPEGETAVGSPARLLRRNSEPRT